MNQPRQGRRSVISPAAIVIWGAALIALAGSIAAYGVGLGRGSSGGEQSLAPVASSRPISPASSVAAQAEATWASVAVTPSNPQAPGERSSAVATPATLMPSTPEPAPTAATTVATPSATPVATLTAAQLTQYAPNELGKVMVLMFHGIDYTGSEYSTTPEEFRADLEWLYRHDFYVIPIHDYISNQIKAPAGKRPVVLTFDDGMSSQFNYLINADGTKTIDPKCAVGIMEAFYSAHPDFGRGGLFAILPLAPFAWPNRPDQEPYAAEKIQFLIDHQYEIADHTVHHLDLSRVDGTKVKEELATAFDMLRKFSPQAQLEVVVLPFGMYPKGAANQALLSGFDYGGKQYAFKAALMVGAEPAPAPVNADFDPIWIPRIRGTTEILKQWFAYVDANPGIMYVSDGNPETLTIPGQLPSELAGKLDNARAAGKTIVRY